MYTLKVTSVPCLSRIIFLAPFLIVATTCLLDSQPPYTLHLSPFIPSSQVLHAEGRAATCALSVLQYPEFLDALRTQVPEVATVRPRTSTTATGAAAAGAGVAAGAGGDVAAPGGQQAAAGAVEGSRYGLGSSHFLYVANMLLMRCTIL